MKKPVKLKKLIIDRNTWARGGQNGSAALLNKEGNMCCLGFACERQGIPKAELKEYGEPGDFAVNYTSHATASTKAELAKRLGGLVVFEEDDDAYYDEDEGDEAPFTFHNSNWSDKAIEINDDVDISDKMREYRLRPILRKMGFDVKFTGPVDE